MGTHRYRFLSAYPEGTMSAYEFATRRGVAVESLRNDILYGVDGERIEVTEIPRMNRLMRYLTPEQQKKALEFWDRHGVKYRKRGNI